MAATHVPGSAYTVDKSGSKWVLTPMTDEAGCIMLDMKTPDGFRSKKAAVEWVNEKLLPHPDAMAPLTGFVATWVGERVTRKATRTTSEKRSWIVTLKGKYSWIHKEFGYTEGSEAAALKYAKRYGYKPPKKEKVKA